MSEEVPHTSLIVNLQSLSKQITFNVMKYLNIIKISQVRRLLTDEYETPVMFAYVKGATGVRCKQHVLEELFV